MIDLHSHLLPGIDDGPRDTEGSLAMARRAVEDGITTAVVTPHIDHTHRVLPSAVPEAALRLRHALRDAGLELALLTGGELSATRLAELSDAELRTVALGRSSWVLLECPLRPSGAALETAVFELRVRGFRALLAHPERSRDLMGDVDRVRRLVDGGSLCSVTAGALLGDFGSTVRRAAFQLLDERLVHNVASDGHDEQRRPLALSGALRAAAAHDGNGEAVARWLGLEVPQAILADRSVPERPPREGSRRPGGLRAMFGRRQG